MQYCRLWSNLVFLVNIWLYYIFSYPDVCDVGLLRELYSELATKLDARVVAVNMYQSNALTLKELQSIQSQRDRPIDAAETLLNIILKQPGALYLCFLDVLKHTEQQHIYLRLVEGGYKGQLNCVTEVRCHVRSQLQVY